jgi:hypothetical protein
MKGRKVLFFIAVILLTLLIAVPMVWAGPNEARELVAPYGHFPAAVGSATGPFTTHYLVSSTTSLGATVNMKCYDDGEDLLAPTAGTTINLGPFDMDAIWLSGVSGLTTDPHFSGYGWCYFAVTSGDDIAVTFIAGLSVGNDLITTNNSTLLMADTAQSYVTINDANIPYWTKEGSWNTYLLALNPTTTNRTITMNVYNPSGGLLGTWTGLLGGLGPRDMDFISIPDAVGATGYGNADITMSGRGFVGWVAGVNYTSFQGFIYAVPLDKDDVSALAVGDRP